MILGVIGGSGLYQLDGVKGDALKVETPYGAPSGEVTRIGFGENTLLFLPRHGLGHTLLPSEVNYRANIFALKKLGAKAVVSVSAVGSMKEEIEPGTFVLPDQYIDLTKGLRPATFFGGGVVGHLPMADPTCPGLRAHLATLVKGVGVPCHPAGTYVCVEGPQFSTRAESQWFRSWNRGEGVSVIGMTAMPEARLAREAGLCYQTVAMATDYDCWNTERGEVSVEAILKVLADNVSASRQLIESVGRSAFPACFSGCNALMKQSVVTAGGLWPAKKRAELEIILA